MKKYQRKFNENTFKIGDKVLITTPRTRSSKTYKIKITQIVNKNIVKGTVLEGPMVGYTETGTVVDLA